MQLDVLSLWFVNIIVYWSVLISSVCKGGHGKEKINDASSALCELYHNCSIFPPSNLLCSVFPAT